jgi:XTP/dITP diphosphohydrolase
MPMGFDQTYAELGDEVKNKLSHRAKALEKLKQFFTSKSN